MRLAILMLMVLLLALGATPAAARAPVVDLHRGLCTATLPDGASNAAVVSAPYACGADAPQDSPEWLWLRLDASRLHDLAPGWHLLVDQTRFDRIAVVAGGRDGMGRIELSARQLAGHGAPGGVLRFTIPPAGRDIDRLYLGYRRIDHLSLMRKLKGIPAEEQPREDAPWLALMGLFAGALLSALAYNSVINAGQRQSFQRWYVLWVASAFAYGMVWTNMAAYVFPGLVGPFAVRIDYALVGFMIGAGNMFFFTVVEDGCIPRRFIRAGRALAVAGAVSGCIAAADTIFPVMPTDRALNYVIAATAVLLAISCGIAIRRGSRVVWFYLVGWGPVIGMFLARLARNLGMVPQNDLVDFSSFGALAFEALVLSLAIADRFRHLRQALAMETQQREIQLVETKALRQAAQTDFLTGLGNRAAFQDATRALIHEGAPFALYLIDVDYLKDANDRLGHAGGDAMLQRIATALVEIAATVPGAHVSRIGGDEFALLFPGSAEVDAAMAERLTDLQGRPWTYLGQTRPISLSIGSARAPDDATAPDLLYQNADLALYHAKRRGRGHQYRYDPLLRILRDLQVEFTRDAEAALTRGEFRLDLQPIVLLPSGACCGYEALLRWNHPDHGLMLPDRFADVLVAEKIGARIQDHVLDLAMGWLRDRPDEIRMLSVNFTSAQLAGPRAARQVLDRLAAYGVPPSSLCIEVTERVMLDRAADTILETLRTLHRAGIQIALDDFGTGFASLVHLRDMPVDRIKIDRSFVAGLDEVGGGTLAIVRAIIGLGRGLGKIVVAEGIETPAQAERLVALGCHLGQGFLYGRAEPHPLPANAPTYRTVQA